jgi:hypothetical protein
MGIRWNIEYMLFLFACQIKPIRRWSWGIDESVFREGKFIVRRASA